MVHVLWPVSISSKPDCGLAWYIGVVVVHLMVSPGVVVVHVLASPGVVVVWCAGVLFWSESWLWSSCLVVVILHDFGPCIQHSAWGSPASIYWGVSQ